MTTHRWQGPLSPRGIAAASVVALGATTLSPVLASADEYTVPGTNVTFTAPGVQDLANIQAAVPSVDEITAALMQGPAELFGRVHDLLGTFGAGSAFQLDGTALQSIVDSVTPYLPPQLADGLNQLSASLQAGIIDQINAAAAPFIGQTQGFVDQLSSQSQVQPAELSSNVADYGSAAISTIGNQIVAIAQSKIGSPYAYGAAGPDAFDCSGFTSWVYQQVGKTIPRTSEAQASSGQPVAYDDLQPGDIVAFYSGASHVGIYAGNGQIIDALNEGTPVGYRSLDYMPFHSAVRY